MAAHLLLVDDDALFRRGLAFMLERSGFRVSTTGNAEDALALAGRDRPDLVLLDIGLPGMDGLDALRHFDSGLSLPVIFLSGHQREIDQVLGLMMGADDYIVKPVSFDVLVARVNAVLRRSRAPQHSDEPRPLTVGDLAIDPQARKVSIKGQPIELRPREFDLLYVLARQAGRVVSTDDLVTQVWGVGLERATQIVSVYIHSLRRKLQDTETPRRLLTVRRVGYKLQPQGEQARA